MKYKTKEYRRPGRGWKKLSGSVWEHKGELRIHTNGIVRLPNGRIVSAGNYPQSREVAQFFRMNGGNRKRGLMAWAMSLISASKDHAPV